MQDQNKRATKGTEHTLTSQSLLGGEFIKIKNAPFIEKRAELWDEFYKTQEEAQKLLPKDKISITLKDGKIVEGVLNETSPLEIGKKCMKKSILNDILVAKVFFSNRMTSSSIANTEEEEKKQDQGDKWIMWDMVRPLEGDCKLEFCSFEDKEGKNVFWHSSAHVLGSAIENAYGSKLCIGPALEEGFYYDSYMGKNVIESSVDYPIIEEEAKKITQGNHLFQRLTMTKTQALDLFKNNPFKVQLITAKVPENGQTTAYRCGNFIDLCLGPHIINTNLIKALKVTKNSSTNWLGKVTNDSLQRAYGIAFPSDKLLKEWVLRKEEEEKRDHRNIGKQQDLFMFHPLSPGSCFFYEHGAYIYNKLIDFLRNELEIRSYTEVVSPNIFNLKLWKTSGHYKNYKENMFIVKIDNSGYGLKPMNCPGHCLMFDNYPRSYKELPMRFSDFGVLHRNEISGALSGLTRVRRFQQDDAHIFCTYEQIMDEVHGCLDLMNYIYTVFGFDYELYLSTRPAKMLGDSALWDLAEKALADALNKFGKPWKINPGDGAFYGPKIDILIFDALKRGHQCCTVQVDFQLPIRFNLIYRTEEQLKKEEDESKGNKKKEERKQKNEKKKKSKKENEENSKEEQKFIEENAKFELKEPKSNEETKPKEEEKKQNFPKEIYQSDEWDEEQFVWEEQPLKPGYKRPCIIHRTILGSVERSMAILIEHYAGKWPFWLSPRQICIATVSDKVNEFADRVYLKLKLKGYQVTFDKSSSTLQKKVRNAQLAQFNFIAVIGNEEVAGNCVDIRTRDGDRIGKYTIPNLIKYFKTLEPQPSEKRLALLKELNATSNNELLDNLENKLEKNLYLNGDELTEEDKTTYASLENVEVKKKNHPNVFLWKKLLNKMK